MPAQRARLTLADIPDLPPLLTIPVVAALLDISRTSAYQLASADQLPVPVVRVGRSLRVPTRPLLAALGLTDTEPPTHRQVANPGPRVARDQEPSPNRLIPDPGSSVDETRPR